MREREKGKGKGKRSEHLLIFVTSFTSQPSDLLKIYTAIQLLRILDKGGSTYPWVVELLDERQNPVAFVVKMFTPKQIQQQHAVAKEVYGNVLAAALDLLVPEAVLARFTPTFIATLDSEAKSRNAECHRGLRFASRHHEGYTIFGDQLPNSKIRDYDMASVYAFDNLVRNLDRGGERNKPNLLVRDEDYLLIDHEQIFPFADDPDNPNTTVVPAFLRGEWLYNHEKHLFYPYLKKMKPDTKKEMFTPFMESLRRLDPYLLEETSGFLSENGQLCADIDLITEYLCAIKANPEIFLGILQRQLA